MQILADGGLVLFRHCQVGSQEVDINFLVPTGQLWRVFVHVDLGNVVGKPQVFGSVGFVDQDKDQVESGE